VIEESREQCSRERHERDREQKKQIAREQSLIALADQVEETVMIHPHHADRKEARREREIRRPQLDELACELSRSGMFRRADFENQQRHRDRTRRR